MPVAVEANGNLNRTHDGGANGFDTSTAPSFAPTDTTAHDLNIFAELEGKDVGQQLEILTNQLEMENRIKEGAENMLNMQLTGALRSKVESELYMAMVKIEAITKRIDMQASRGGPRKKSTSSGSGVSTKRKFVGQGPPTAKARANIEDKDSDDFRTALNHATSYVKALNNMGRTPATPPAASPSSSSTSTPGEASSDRSRIDAMTKLIGIMQRNLRVRYELNIVDLVHAVIPALADRCSKQCRTTAYRLIRHGLVDSESVDQLRQQPLDWYIVKSLARDNKHAMEKEQVIKLIRAIVEIGSARRHTHAAAAGLGTVPLSEPVMRAFIAVAEHPDDPFRPICIETLSEILLIDIDLVARTGGIRFLLHCLGESPIDIGPMLASTFLYIIDLPRTRAYLHVGTDLEIAISAVTDAYGKGPDHADRMRGCARIIQLMLRTWSGLMYFCMNDMAAIRSIIDTLRIPSLDTREVVLDMFFDLLNIKAPEWYQTFIDGRRLTMYRRSRLEPKQHHQVEEPERSPEALKLTDQYLALLILVFTNAGLMEALTSMLEEAKTGSNLSRKATLLMAEVLQMANRVLPLSVAARIQAIPQVFDLAANYMDGGNRIVGTLALSAIDSFNRNKGKLQSAPQKNSRARASSIEDAVRRGQRQVEQVRIKMGMQMDDKTFQASLLETQVMLTKDHTKWDFDVLQELIEGPLLNPRRMEEAIKVSRFIRRLTSFFHPFSHRFSDMARTKDNARWVRMGSTLLVTLMSSSDGLRFLASDDDLLKQIVKSFAQLDPFNGAPESDPIFSKKRVAETLTYGYFEMLGTLSKHKEGIELMEKHKIFTAFYHLSELRSREDLIKGIIENLDYSIDGHPRIVLSKALTSSYKHIRLFATNHLGELIRKSPHANAWTLRLLLTQLYDPAPDVCEMAVHFLEEACEMMDILQLVVEMQPTMDHLGEIGHPLLMKFMSTPIGFRYLYDAGYIDREMDMWFHERNIYYVVQVEIFLAQVFNHSSSLNADSDDVLAFDGTVPSHFYGEMSKTELGCQVLQEKGHFSEFAHFIRQHGLETEDSDIILKLKSILWTVGNVGSTEGGLPFLEEEEITPAILEIAENSAIPSVRGTCFFVLGLISSTSQGAEILDDYQWEATLSPLGLPTGLCIPVDLDKFVSVPTWSSEHPPEDAIPRLIPPTTQQELEVITAIQNLANSVIANAASRSLAKMKSRHEYKHIFSSPTMFYRALQAISTQRYRLPVRRYILDLFNLELDSSVVDKLTEAAKSIRAPASFDPPKSSTERVVSMFGVLGRTRQATESDEEEDDLDGNEVQNVVTDKRPAISLRPVSRIVGFDDRHG
ncbi:hypothetical protein PLICRDRAFT_43412 [Plicaturopsis crispa FD-325 SS-3]|nr:hypothetical protein PLICRDRAFT_43412 [Plicaturopsis crispa FD-325 SS-3]